MTPNELAKKALTVFNPQIEEPPTIDLPIHFNNVLLCTIRFRHDDKQWIGNASDWEMKDIVDCFENPQKYGIRKAQENG